MAVKLTPTPFNDHKVCMNFRTTAIKPQVGNAKQKSKNESSKM